jgi:hypothetical protein
MIDFCQKPSIVLSCGRTASVLQCQNIKKNLESAGFPQHATKIVHIKDQTELEKVSKYSMILHSHLMLSNQKLQRYIKIISVRQNYTEQLLSFFLATKFNKYHQMCNESLASLTSFEFTDWNMLKSLCRNFVHWHTYYSKSLSPNDLVVVYENFITNFKSAQIQQEIYSNKSDLITNYWQVSDFIKNNLNENQVLDKFYQHQNLFDIYDYITQ